MVFNLFRDEWEELRKSDLYKYDRVKYYKIRNEIEGRWMEALRKEYRTEGNTKEALLFSTAWELGHSQGHHEVEVFYSDLANLIL